MKLKPKMEVNETHDSFVISSYIPGMNKDDIEIQLGNTGKTITVSGFRLPTKNEEQQLKKSVLNKIKNARYIHPEEDMDSVSTLQDITSYWRFYCKS
jgi:HSP20 family molecular chaperone IbpA